MITFTHESQRRLSNEVRTWERSPHNREHVDQNLYRAQPLTIFGTVKTVIEHNAFGEVYPGSYADDASGTPNADTVRALNPGHKIELGGCPVILMRCALAFGETQWVIVQVFSATRWRTTSEVEDRTNNPQTSNRFAACDWFNDIDFISTASKTYSYCLALTMNDTRQKRIQQYWDTSALETRYTCYSGDCPP